MSARWLDGACNIPEEVSDLAPNDPRFVDWMTGDGARALLSVNLDWWLDPKTFFRIKYEDLVAQPIKHFETLIDALGLPIAGDLPGALQRYSISYFARFSNHGWIGRPGSYANFITQENCELVKTAHRTYFQTLGYEISPITLTPEAARERYFDALSKG